MKTFIRRLFMALVVMLFASAMQAQQTYDVKLVSHNSHKIALIKLLRNELSLGLKEAKELVESAPCIVLENAEKERADDLAGKITAAGGTAEVIPSSVTKYDLVVAGVDVTSATAGDLSVIPGVEGKVSYDHSTKTLTLEDASITVGQDKYAISSRIDGLTIEVKGNCTLASENWAAIVSDNASFTIAGSGTLNAEAKGYVAIYPYKCALTIKDCTVNAKGTYGIAGNDGLASEQLTIDNATVTAEGRVASIADFSQFTLNDCKITQPAGAVWNAEKKALCDADGEKITAKVTIEPVEKYALKVAGVDVTAANAGDLSKIPGVEGKVSYDHSTKILTLEDATITTANSCIFSRIDGLTIWVKGNSTLTTDTEGALCSYQASFTIAGSGTLNVNSNNAAVLADRCALTIKDCTVNAKGIWGISGRNGYESEQLTIDNATVTAEGSSGSICDLSKFTLNDCKITQPAGAVWNAEKKALCDADGNVITAKVTIAPVEKYDLVVAGVDVTAANAANITGEGITGKVSYDHSTKTLTLEDASITVGEDKVAILSKIDGLTIEVKGNSTLTGKNFATIVGYHAFTIAGSGTLNVNSKNDGCILAAGSALTIKDCTVNANGAIGIIGGGAGSTTLTIDNATVTAEGSTASIVRFSQFTLNRCAITAPVGAVWNAEEKALCDADGHFITAKVTIAPVPQGIDGLNAETARSRGIYNLHGVRLDTDFDQLPSGVYIVDGQKVMK